MKIILCMLIEIYDELSIPITSWLFWKRWEANSFSFNGYRFNKDLWKLNNGVLESND